ncbi:hypothetical protein LguiB_002339 [Lonicera macranthoides]
MVMMLVVGGGGWVGMVMMLVVGGGGRVGMVMMMVVGGGGWVGGSNGIWQGWGVEEAMGSDKEEEDNGETDGEGGDDEDDEEDVTENGWKIRHHPEAMMMKRYWNISHRRTNDYHCCHNSSSDNPFPED